MRTGIKPLDFLAIVIGIGAVILLSVAAYQGPARDTELHITISDGNWIYPLAEDRVIEVDGPLGTTTVVIDKKGVRITDSPCPQKLCIQKGEIRLPGQWNACLPNRVFLNIEGTRIDPEGTKLTPEGTRIDPNTTDGGPIDAHSH